MTPATTFRALARARGPSRRAALAAAKREYATPAAGELKPNLTYLPETHPDSSSSPTTLSLISSHSSYLLNTYARPPLLFTRGKGCKLYAGEPTTQSGGDVTVNAAGTKGEIEYLDFTAGIAVTALGHSDEGIAKIMAEQSQLLMHSSNVCWNEWAGELAKILVESTRKFGGLGLSQGGDISDVTPAQNGSKGAKVFFANSGTEANEGALKFARKWGKENPNGGSPQKTGLVCFSNAFHGRSLGALSVTPNPKYQAPFAPLIPNVRVGELNCEVEALRDLVDEGVCGVIVEPIQGEGGLNEGGREWMRELARRTREVGAVLIYDEIQCGLFRTGNMWAHGNFPIDAQPDIVTMAKPLANGFPIGAIMVRDEVAEKITPGSHGTTFGGQVLATRLGHHVLTRLTSPSFLTHLESTSSHLDSLLSRLPLLFPNIIPTAIRGRGLMRGIPFSNPNAPGELVRLARQRGVLLLTAGSDAVRLVPSLVVSGEECEKAVGVIESCLAIMEGEGKWGKQ